MRGEVHSIIDFDLRVGLEGSQRNRRPLCVHLSDSLLDFKANFYLLISREFDDGDADLLLLVSTGEILNGLDSPNFLIFSL